MARFCEPGSAGASPSRQAQRRRRRRAVGEARPTGDRVANPGAGGDAMLDDARPAQALANPRACPDTPPGPTARTTGIVVLAVLATITALYFGRVFFVPIAFAL